MADSRKKTWKHHRRADKNQQSVVDYLRRFGVVVYITNMVGNGFPDLVCEYLGYFILIEVKKVGGKLTPDQVPWHAAARGPAFVVESGVEALRVITTWAVAQTPRADERLKQLRDLVAGQAGQAACEAFALTASNEQASKPTAF